MEFIIVEFFGRLFLALVIPTFIIVVGFAAICFEEIFVRLPKILRYSFYYSITIPMAYVGFKLLFEKEVVAALMGFTLAGLGIGIGYNMEKIIKQR